MYRVEWLDFDGETKTARGFKTSEEAHEWIRTHLVKFLTIGCLKASYNTKKQYKTIIVRNG